MAHNISHRASKEYKYTSSSIKSCINNERFLFNLDSCSCLIFAKDSEIWVIWQLRRNSKLLCSKFGWVHNLWKDVLASFLLTTSDSVTYSFRTMETICYRSGNFPWVPLWWNLLWRYHTICSVNPPLNFFCRLYRLYEKWASKWLQKGKCIWNTFQLGWKHWWSIFWNLDFGNLAFLLYHFFNK